MITTFYTIHYGFPWDSGFGDAGEIFWLGPAEINGQIVWFSDEKAAEQVAEELTKLSSNEFYSVGEHDRYDGNFPYEYEARKIVIPDSEEVSSSAAVEGIAKEHKDMWTENVYYPPEEDEDDE